MTGIRDELATMVVLCEKNSKDMYGLTITDAQEEDSQKRQDRHNRSPDAQSTSAIAVLPSPSKGHIKTKDKKQRLPKRAQKPKLRQTPSPVPSPSRPSLHPSAIIFYIPFRSPLLPRLQQNHVVQVQHLGPPRQLMVPLVQIPAVVAQRPWAVRAVTHCPHCRAPDPAVRTPP